MTTTIPTSAPHMLHVPTTVVIERADTRHLVHRSGLKRLGYNDEQRARIRDIQLELTQCKS